MFCYHRQFTNDTSEDLENGLSVKALLLLQSLIQFLAPHVSSQLSITPVIGDSTPSFDLPRLWAHGTHKYMQANIHLHKSNTFLKIIKANEEIKAQ